MLEEEEVVEDIFSLGILSWFDIVLSDGTILKNFAGFSPLWFPR